MGGFPTRNPPRPSSHSRQVNAMLITNILFPVAFSPSCVAMAPYVQRAAAMFGARVSLLHVVDPASHSGFELYSRTPFEISEEHLEIGRERLAAFLPAEFPVDVCPRIIAAGDAATHIAKVAREGRFDLIVMPTHAGIFRQMLLGSTTAKVLDDADCFVLTSRHAETIAPRPLEHREWLCAMGLSSHAERVLRYASQGAAEVNSRLSIIHAIQGGDPDLTVQLDLQKELHSAEKQKATERITEIQRAAGTDVPVRISVGSVKKTLLRAVGESDADVLIMGRGPRSGTYGRLRDLSYAMIRDSPFPVLSI
jgi:nucleotide-binding universal stress UspA family protein